jgi:hypothetical protein
MTPLATRSEIGLRRLRQQGLTQARFADAAEAVGWLGGIQGQDYASAKWSLGLRIPGSTDATIEAAIVERKILRTWVMRGTLFYVAAADIHWMLGLLAPRIIQWNARRYAELELDADTLTRSTAFLAEVLSDGLPVSRTDLFDALNRSGFDTRGQRGVYMLNHAGLQRVLHQAELIRNVPVYQALAEGPTLPPDEAIAELARRYFQSRGPATLDDFKHWSGMLISDARAGLQAIQSTLVEQEIDGQNYWMTPEAAEPLTASDSGLLLLPGFDEFVLGYKDRSAVLEPQFTDAICPGGNGVFFYIVVRDGRIIATWKRTLKKSAVEIAITPLYALSAADHAAIAEAAQAFGAFVGLPVSL